MKFFLVIISIFISSCLIAQDSTFLQEDSLHTISGFVIFPGQQLKIGSGSAPDGDFKYISVSTSSLMYGTSDNRGLANGYNSLSRQNAHHDFKVVRIDTRGNKKHGYYYYPIITEGATRYQVDIDDAIASGEVVVPDEYKKSTSNNLQPQEDVYDKIAKLKKLLDNGAITQDEFDNLKKKLLNQ